jgi:hypothetical protein
MVTLRMAGVLGLLLLAACSASRTAAPESRDPAPAAGGETPPVAILPPDTVEPGGSGPQYPGTGFRVHEWGSTRRRIFRRSSTTEGTRSSPPIPCR